MEKTLKWLRDYGIILLTFVLLLSSMQTCVTRSQVDKNTKSIEVNTRKIDSSSMVLRSGYVVPKNEFYLMLQIEKLKSAKMTLYDWNAVVRTVVRPDDRMNWYDQEINRLQSQLDSIRFRHGN